MTAEIPPSCFGSRGYCGRCSHITAQRRDAVIASGHLSRERPREVGEPITIGSQSGIVRDVGPLLGEREQRVVIQLWRDDRSVA